MLLVSRQLVKVVLKLARRVIAVGDAHGCIDELQDCIRECDYQPGDLATFLADLVCKGPDSTYISGLNGQRNRRQARF
jgi:hypothetical protein